MLPRSSLDILSSASTTQRAPPKSTPLGLEVLTYALPPMTAVSSGVSGISDSGNHGSVPHAGLSQHLNQVLVPSPTTVSFHLGPSYACGQQEGTTHDRMRWSKSLVDTCTMLAYSCIHAVLQ
jgi:hypothetical protein